MEQRKEKLPQIIGIITNGDDLNSVLFKNQVPFSRVSGGAGQGRAGQGRAVPNGKLCITAHITVTPMAAVHESSTMKMQAPGSSEMLVSIRETTRCHSLKGLFSTFAATLTSNLEQHYA